MNYIYIITVIFLITITSLSCQKDCKNCKDCNDCYCDCAIDSYINHVLMQEHRFKKIKKIKRIYVKHIKVHHAYIIDLKNRLMWQRLPISKTMNWYDAKAYCKKLRIANYRDWRLPTKKEFVNLLKLGKAPFNEWLLSIGFKNIEDGSYWTATDLKDAPKSYAMQINFKFGLINNKLKGVSAGLGLHVIAVRSIK